MKVSIHQPNYLPWLAFFDKIKKVDIFVLLDDVQYEKNGFQNRNKIKVPGGWIYLTIPIPRSEYFKKISDVRLPVSDQWQKDHWKSIQMAYSRSSYFNKYKDFFDGIYRTRYQFLTEINIKIIQYLSDVLKFRTKILRESDLDIDPKLKSTDRLIQILKTVGASYYLSGPSGKKYLDLDKFKRENIEIEFQDYNHPIYHQLFGNFIPGLSVIDLLFNEGDKSSKII